MNVRFLDVALSYCRIEATILWRARTPIVYMFLVPAFLSAILGSAVSGLEQEGADGRTAVGFAVLFSYMVVNYSGFALFREHWGGTWMRQALLKPPRLAYITGKLLTAWALGLVQLTTFGTLSFLFLDLPLHGNPVQLVLIGLSLLLSGSAIGVFLFTVTTNLTSFQSITYLVLIGFGALGGAIVATDRLPGPSRALGHLTPHYWALRAFDESTFGGGNWMPTLQAVGLIGLFSSVLLLVAARRFDYRKQKSALV